jgi:hypothetical protein
MKFTYDVHIEHDIIEIHKEDDTYIDIIISEYWEWIKRYDLHHYCIDYFDARESDGHGQEIGKYTKEEYFNLSYESIKDDLTTYLNIKFKS